MRCQRNISKDGETGYLDSVGSDGIQDTVNNLHIQNGQNNCVRYDLCLHLHMPSLFIHLDNHMYSKDARGMFLYGCKTGQESYRSFHL